MTAEHSRIQRVRFYAKAAVLYVLTITCLWYVIHPAPPFAVRASALAKTAQTPYQPTRPRVIVISGRPVRIVIPASAVDLTIDPGYYNSADGSWTLSGYHAQFAMVSTLANNVGGDTFIYGHNNNYVFGPLRHVTPAVGAQALVYTDNGHVFSYNFQDAASLVPDDVSVLDYQGPPMLTVQTCTGSIDEWRTLFRFKFDKVVQ